MAKDRNHKMPAIAWLAMTDYTTAWLERELGGELRSHGQRVLSVQHLPGAREILRMETVEDMMEREPVGLAMSSTRRNCMDAGLRIDPDSMKTHYGVTEEGMKLFMPIECPKMCLTRNGVLRPWTLDVCFGKKQAWAMQKLLRESFWNAVNEFDMEYAVQQNGQKYPAREMIEEFCEATGTPDLYVDTIRREWQRRGKRNAP